MGGPCPIKAAMMSRPSAISLKLWLCVTTYHAHTSLHNLLQSTSNLCSKTSLFREATWQSGHLTLLWSRVWFTLLPCVPCMCWDCMLSPSFRVFSPRAKTCVSECVDTPTNVSPNPLGSAPGFLVTLCRISGTENGCLDGRPFLFMQMLWSYGYWRSQHRSLSINRQRFIEGN